MEFEFARNKQQASKQVLYRITHPMEKCYRSIHHHRHDLSLKNNKVEFYQLTLKMFIGNDKECRNKYVETAINTG